MTNWRQILSWSTPELQIIDEKEPLVKSIQPGTMAIRVYFHQYTANTVDIDLVRIVGAKVGHTVLWYTYTLYGQWSVVTGMKRLNRLMKSQNIYLVITNDLNTLEEKMRESTLKQLSWKLPSERPELGSTVEVIADAKTLKTFNIHDNITGERGTVTEINSMYPYVSPYERFLGYIGVVLNDKSKPFVYEFPYNRWKYFLVKL